MIGATGGSGTRVVARIVRNAGMFVGTRLRKTGSEDALDLAQYYNRWINPFLAGTAAEGEMRAGLEAALAQHLSGFDGVRPWGWKEPRSTFLLPFLDRHLPALRFLHLVRDGRDMAFSANQKQARKHGDAYLRPAAADPAAPARSIALWSELNLATVRYGERELGRRYLRIRFEDLCAEPAAVAARIFDFFELDGDPRLAAAEVTPPPSLGRWRKQDPVMLAELEQIARWALARLGYAPAGAYAGARGTFESKEQANGNEVDTIRLLD